MTNETVSTSEAAPAAWGTARVVTTKEFSDLVDRVSNWDESTAETLRSEVEAAVLHAAGVDSQHWAWAYSFTYASGVFGPFERDPNDADNPYGLQEAEAIVMRAYRETREDSAFSDWRYQDAEMPDDGSDELGNAVLEGRAIHRAVFARIIEIYGER